MSDRQSLGPSLLQGCKFVSLLCPYFCRKRKVSTTIIEKKVEWELTKEEMKRICRYLQIYDEDGFSAIFPHKLHQQWDEYILHDLYETWVWHIYGNKDDILPNLKRFSELVKGQWSGSVEQKARIIFAILLRTSYEETENNGLKINKYNIVKYFCEVFATCLRGMCLRNYPEILMWMSCDADLNESKLHIAMNFFAEELPDMAEVADLRKLMCNHIILGDVLKSVIEMCFGIAPLTNRMVPFPISSTRTILDITHIVMLTAFIGGGVESYEWQMLYNVKEDFSWSQFESAVLRKGPTIILLRDRENWVFGGYASSSWKVSSKFYGNRRSFLFRLFPTFKVFRPSNSDDNFMYLSRGQQSLPSGLAMGGDMDNFGIWINIDKPVGKCNSVCPTFAGYECLSAMSNFFYTDMEVWRLVSRTLAPVTPRGQCSSTSELHWQR
ncbi:uncharacterized protein [Halyomorpha halys]|uniref:uncharacterized protein n=1 Tax=Halyomorpha halys TaxID=286706 RepID=UPI0006D5195A|nr:uncharacterized protein LOC106677890 [Halyomorpha halys]